MRPTISCINPGQPSTPSDNHVHTGNVTPTISCSHASNPRFRAEVFGTQTLEGGDRKACEVGAFWCDEREDSSLNEMLQST